MSRRPPGRRRSARRVVRRVAAVLGVVVAAAAMVLAMAGPASAHATLLSTDPSEGAILATAPDEVRFTFDAEVGRASDGAQVFDASGSPIAASVAGAGNELVVSIDGRVEPGTVVIVWRVVSEDGHPITGSLSFSVGAPSDNVVRPAAEAEAAAAPLLLSLMRWIGYGTLFLTTGLALFLVLFLPADPQADQARRRLLSVTRAGAGVVVVAWLLTLPLVAAYQLGGGVGALTRSETWAALNVFEYLTVAGVVLGVLGTVALLGRGRPRRGRGLAAAGAAVVATCAPALTGHTRAASPEALAVGADVLHLVVGSTWLGGLVALALVLPLLAERGSLASEVLARFSVVAAGLLVALVLAGSLMAVQITESWSALFGTAYGRLLLLKILIAAAAVAVAAWNRSRLVPLVREASRRRDQRAGASRLARATRVEGALIGVVLLVTALLVDRSPTAEASVAADAGTAQVSGLLGGIEVEVSGSPLRPGPNTIAMTMRDMTGQPVEGMEAPRMRLASDQVDLGEVPATNVGPGAYTTQAVLPSVGTWRLQVSLRVSEFENPVSDFELEVVAPESAGAG